MSDAPHGRTPLAQHVRALYDDPFVGGAVADFVDVALGLRGSRTSVIAWPAVAERLERRGFDVGGVVDLGQVEVADGRAAVSWLAHATPIVRPAIAHRRGTSIRVSAWGDRTGLDWGPDDGAPAAWTDLLLAPAGLAVMCDCSSSDRTPLCAFGSQVWRVEPTGPVEVGADASGPSRVTGCARLRASVVVEGHPAGVLSAELALYWLRS